MRRIYLLVILMALFIAGCFHEPKVKDCGTDEVCFQEAAKTCGPAKFKKTQESGTMEFLLKGFEGDKCVLNMKVVDSPVALLKDKEMNCKIPVEEAARLSKGSAMDTSTIMGWCSGSLIDLLKSLGAVS
ncbi:hypothetical protein J4450_03310 [Candidatus Micrarchaeota archaeon]|nr:hypothetical protein [Candidatus Micrarchaeota archaeon]